MLLLACVAPGDLPPAAQPQGPPEQDPRRLSSVALPAELPFTAWTRVTPLTLVDGHGAPVLVIDAVGVELEVSTLLTDRAFVRCVGCRAPVEAWLQRDALFAGDVPGDGPHDAALAWLNAQPDEALGGPRRHGFAISGQTLTAPPWHDEGGYEGEVLVLSPEGSSWALSAATPAAPLEQE